MTKTTSILQLRLLGKPRYQISGQAERELASNKPNELLACVVCNGSMSSQELCDAIWPGGNRNNYHSTKKRLDDQLTRWLGSESAMEACLTIAHNQIGCGEGISSDVSLFLDWAESVLNGTMPGSEAQALTEKANQLFQSGELLQGWTMPWVEKLRDQLRQKYEALNGRDSEGISVRAYAPDPFHAILQNALQEARTEILISALDLHKTLRWPRNSLSDALERGINVKLLCLDPATADQFVPLIAAAAAIDPEEKSSSIQTGRRGLITLQSSWQRMQPETRGELEIRFFSVFPQSRFYIIDPVRTPADEPSPVSAVFIVPSIIGRHSPEVFAFRLPWNLSGRIACSTYLKAFEEVWRDSPISDGRDNSK